MGIYNDSPTRTEARLHERVRDLVRQVDRADARVAELEAKVARIEALCAGAWWTGEVHRDDIRAVLAGDDQ